MGLAVNLLILFIVLILPIGIYIRVNRKRRSNIEQEKPVQPKKKTSTGTWIGTFLVFGLIATAGGGVFFFQIPFLLFFGWLLFIIKNIPQMTPNWEMIGGGAAGLILLSLGGHAFLKWLYAHWGTGEDTASPNRVWKPAWTGGLVGLLFLMFGASIGTIGAAHQTAWMLSSDDDLLQSSFYKFRVFDSDAKSNLHNIYLGCKAYWAENGSSENCDLATVSQPEYGYVQSQRVVVQLGGKETDFHALASHLKSDAWYLIDPDGNIEEIIEATPR